jgi:hypothetical protein
MADSEASAPRVSAGKVTITRTSAEDVKTRQLVVSVDGEKIATLMWGDSVTRDLSPGPHLLRVHNTLVWRTMEFTLSAGEEAVFEAINRTGKLTYFLVSALGAGPLYVTLRRVT